LAATDDDPLDFSFIKSPPGEFVQLETHRLHVNCLGEGSVTVLFEPGLGGNAFEWHLVQSKIAEHAIACTYDRAGYGWLAKHRPEQIIGMILVDASHEDQLERMETPGKTKILPSGNTFVIARAGVPDNLPNEIARKVEAFLRMRKSYAATEREMRSFRASIDQIKQLNDSYSIPLTVIHRGLNPLSVEKDGEARHIIWGELQQSLSKLSSDGQVVVASNSGHHVHIDEPDLIIDAIMSLLKKEGAF